MKLYNYFSRKKQKFKPLKKGFVSIYPHTNAVADKKRHTAEFNAAIDEHRIGVGVYSCGPTVYDFVHLGNLRTYIFSDILCRALRYNGFQTKQVMNITDVDDKIIKNIKNISSLKKYNWQKKIKIFTEPYIKAFFLDNESLNIKKADFYPRATENISAMLEIIKILLEKGYAYQASDGVYFNVKKFKKYGKLSNLKKRQIKPGARVSADEYQKDNASDFVLWKFTKTRTNADDTRTNADIIPRLSASSQRESALEKEPAWKSPWGPGRPGWHIECAAMSIKYLGQPFDIHTGAVDLLFPHHENEIAEAEAAFNKKFVNYFLEGEHLLVEGQKMAKSLGNALNLEILRRKNFNPLAFRYLCLTSHYRSQLNFTWQSLRAAENAMNNLKTAVINLIINEKLRAEMQKLKCKNKNDPEQITSQFNPEGVSPQAGPYGAGGVKFKNNRSHLYKKRFLDAVKDDLNMPKALSIVWEFIADANICSKDKLILLLEFDQILGLGLEYYYKIGLKKAKGIGKIMPLIKARERLRKEKRWKEADKIRKRIEEMGYILEDSETDCIIKIKN